MSKWVIDHKDTYIAVHEETDLTNRVFREKSKLVYGEFGQIIVNNNGCPPDKDCSLGQNCHVCYVEWLE